jgi:hypothetical protein
MYTVKHINVFFGLLATSSGPYGHHQANIVQKFVKSFYNIGLMTQCFENVLYYCCILNDVLHIWWSSVMPFIAAVSTSDLPIQIPS